MDAVACVTRYAQLSAAVKKQLALAVKCTFLRAACAVGQCVVGTFGQNDEGSLVAQQVECCRVRIGDAYAIEFYGIFLVARHRKGAVRGRAAHHVADLLRVAMTGCNVTSVNRNFHAVFGLRFGVGQVYVNLCRELIILQRILFIGEIFIGHSCRFGTCPVDGYIKGGQISRCCRGAATAGCCSAIVFLTGLVVIILKRVFSRTVSHCCDGCCKQHRNHQIFHNINRI